MRSTVFPIVDLPEEPVWKRIQSLNRMLRDAGVGPDRLVVMWVEEPEQEERLELMMEPLRMKNVPFNELLRYVLGSTIFRSAVGEGVVELGTGFHQKFQRHGDEDESDPFAAPGEVSKPAEAAADDDDPDPFAPPR